jgi:hypothetical protein
MSCHARRTGMDEIAPDRVIGLRFSPRVLTISLRHGRAGGHPRQLSLRDRLRMIVGGMEAAELPFQRYLTKADDTFIAGWRGWPLRGQDVWGV